VLKLSLISGFSILFFFGLKSDEYLTQELPLFRTWHPSSLEELYKSLLLSKSLYPPTLYVIAIEGDYSFSVKRLAVELYCQFLISAFV
jgi:hypothetical protein